MGDFVKLCMIADGITNAMNETDDCAVLMTVLGTCLDQWTADKGKTYDEVHEWLAYLVQVHEAVNSELGPMKV